MDDPNYDGGWLTDSILVASVDQENGNVKLVSLPRDLKSQSCTATSKINEIYYCTYAQNDGTAESIKEHEKQAAEELEEAVEEVLGITIQYYIHINWQAVVQAIDALGGIDIAVVEEGETWSGPEVAIETTDSRGDRKSVV